MKEVVDILTRPLTAMSPSWCVDSSSRSAELIDMSITSAVFPRQWHDGFHAHGPATQEKVDAMLKGTSHKPDQVAGKMTRARGAFPEWSYTVKQVP